jgi:multidrug resistance efflux pump
VSEPRPSQPKSPPISPTPERDHTASRTGARETPPSNINALIAGRIIGPLIVLGAIILSVYVTHLYYVYPRTDDAYVRTNIVGLAPHVSGPIVELPIRDNQQVKSGELLFIVDPRPYKSALDKAEANLGFTNLQIKALEDAIRSASARQEQLAADAAYNKQYLERIEPLLRRHFVTANDVFNARSRLAAAQASVDSAQSEVRKAQNELGQYGDVNVLRKASEAAVYDAKLNVDYCYVRAPLDGYVTNLNIAVGQYANEGKEVLSLVDNRQWYVLANFRENFLEHIRPGMRADVYLLSYPNKRFNGRVQGVGWALYQGNGGTVQGLPQGGGNAQLGAALAAISGPDRSRRSRSLVSFSDGRYRGRDDSRGSLRAGRWPHLSINLAQQPRAVVGSSGCRDYWRRNSRPVPEGSAPHFGAPLSQRSALL